MKKKLNSEYGIQAMNKEEKEYYNMKTRKKQLMKEFAITLADIRKEGGWMEEPAFEIPEVAYKCGVTEQTVRNFEDGTSINPIVLLYYYHWISYLCIDRADDNFNRIQSLVCEIVD